MYTETRNTREDHRQLQAQHRQRVDAGEAPAVTAIKAIGFCLKFVLKGGVLTVAWGISRKTGNLAATLVVICGSNIHQSPSLDALAWGMGVATAARFLVEMTRMRSKHGSIAYNEQAIADYSDDPGHWEPDALH
jgi:hypothetical protein